MVRTFRLSPEMEHPMAIRIWPEWLLQLWLSDTNCLQFILILIQIKFFSWTIWWGQSTWQHWTADQAQRPPAACRREWIEDRSGTNQRNVVSRCSNLNWSVCYFLQRKVFLCVQGAGVQYEDGSFQKWHDIALWVKIKLSYNR